MTRRYHLHLPGVFYVALSFMVGFAAFNTQNNLLFWILGVMLASLVISGVVSGVMMQGLRVRRLVPGNAAVGEPLALRYAVTNRNRLLPAFDIHIEELPPQSASGWPRFMSPAQAWIMHLGPRETVHGEAIFWPRQRGEAELDRLRIWTTFPFGIIKKSITISQPQRALVHPLLYSLRRGVLSAVAPQGLAGARMSSHTGAGEDYYGMREFRPGDSIRNVAWKRSACLDELVCLERTLPTPPRLRVVLNLTAPPDRRPEPGGGDADSQSRLQEQAISLAASLIDAAHRSGFEVGLSLPGTGRPPLLVRRGHWHREKMMAALAGIDLERPRTKPALTAATQTERAAQIVVHPDRADPAVGRDDALHLTARQLPSLVTGPLGWDPTAAPPVRPDSGVHA